MIKQRESGMVMIDTNAYFVKLASLWRLFLELEYNVKLQSVGVP